MRFFLGNLQYGWRLLLKSPVFTLGAVISLAIGIAANTAVFSLINAILLRPLPVAEPTRLVNLHGTASDGSSYHSFSYLNYRDYGERTTGVFSGLLAYSLSPLSWSVGDQAETGLGFVVSENYFSVLGLTPAAGRFFSSEEGASGGGAPVAVISHRLWRSRFGTDRALIGGPVKINGYPFTLIGVAPERYCGTFQGICADFYLPLSMQAHLGSGESLDDRAAVWLEVMGRLKPGVDVEAARAAVSAVALQLAKDYPEQNEGTGAEVGPLAVVPGPLAGVIKAFLGMLMVVTILLLLVASVNVASMFLARAAARRREIAVRIALGASRGQLFSQLLAESLVLFALAAAAGIALATWTTRLLPAMTVPAPFAMSIQLLFDLSIDHRVLAFSLLLSLATGAFFGLAPMWQASKPDLVPALKSEEASGQGYKRLRARNVLVVAQVAFSLVLLAIASLLLRAVQKSRVIDPGFSARDVQLVSLNLARQGYDATSGAELYRAVVERVAALPGVEGAAFANMVPLGLANQTTGVNAEGHPPPADGTSWESDFAVVSPGYFSTLRMPLLRGRDFDGRDNAESTPVVIINQALADHFWPNQDPIGRTLIEGELGSGTRLEVVGVTKTGKYRWLGEDDRLYLYRPASQRYSPYSTLHIRHRGDPRPLLEAVRRTVRGLDSSLPLVNVMPMESYIAFSLLPHRFAAGLAGVLGLVGLLLVAVGIYGLVSYFTNQRTREMGLRMALGARAEDVLGLVLRQGLTLALVGSGVGLVLALLVTRALSRFMFGLGAFEGLTIVGVAALLVVVALAASYLPARRSSNLPPMVALRRG